MLGCPAVAQTAAAPVAGPPGGAGWQPPAVDITPAPYARLFSRLSPVPAAARLSGCACAGGQGMPRQGQPARRACCCAPLHLLRPHPRPRPACPARAAALAACGLPQPCLHTCQHRCDSLASCARCDAAADLAWRSNSIIMADALPRPLMSTLLASAAGDRLDATFDSICLRSALANPAAHLARPWPMSGACCAARLPARLHRRPGLAQS